MSRVHVVLAAATAALVLAACSQATSPPAPTQAPAAKAAAPTQAPAAPTAAPAAPTKAAEPTKPAAAQPTAAPAPKVNFPQKGKTITIIVPFDAGGPTDIQSRLTAQLMEKDLGTTVEVITKPGAGSQLGTEEMLRSKPDGYTMMLTSHPTTLQIYLDASRKTSYSRKDFQPVANQTWDPGSVAVAITSPFQDVKDLVDAAKAKPEGVKMATVGAMTNSHLWAVMLEKMAGIKFALVHFSGNAPATTALLGGHVDVKAGAMGNTPSLVKAGQVRVLGVMDRDESPYLPGTKTFAAQGYPLYVSASRGYSVPAGTPKEVVEILNASIKRVSEVAEFKQKMAEQGQTVRYLDPAGYAKLWDEMEAEARPLMSLMTAQ